MRRELSPLIRLALWITAHLRPAVCLLAILIVFGPTALTAQTDEPKPGSSRVVLINSDNADEELAKTLAWLPIEHRDAETELWKQYCGAVRPSPDLEKGKFSFKADAVTWLLGKLVKWLVNAIDKEIQKKLKTYGSLHASDSEEIDFYVTRGELDPGTAWAPKYRYSCFAYTHLSEKPGNDGKAEVGMSVLGQMKLEQTRYSQVRPLRLYYRAPDADSKEKDNKKEVGLAIAITADAKFWDENKPLEMKDIFKEAELLTAKLTMVKGADDEFILQDPYRTLKTEGWSWSPRLSMIPYSKYQDGRFDSSWGIFRVAVAEVGNEPELLKKLGEFFNKNTDKIRSKLEELIQKAIEKLEEK